MSYTIVEWDKVRREAPEFQRTLRELEERMIENTLRLWSPLTYGGSKPGSKQFGRTTIPPQFFMDANNDVLDEKHVPATWGTNSFRQLFTATSPTAGAIPGWKLILQGGDIRAPGSIPEKIRIGLAGFSFPSKAKCITKLKMQYSESKIPEVDIEEGFSYNKFAIIFEEGYELDEQEGWELWGFFEASGYQRVKPLGMLFYKKIQLVL